MKTRIGHARRATLIAAALLTITLGAMTLGVGGADALPPVPLVIDVNMANQGTNDRELNIVVVLSLPTFPSHAIAWALV